MGPETTLNVIDTTPKVNSEKKFRIRVNGSGTVYLWSENGTEPLQQWIAAVDAPRFEKQNDGRSIRIGFKRYIIDETHSEDAVNQWFNNIIEAPAEEVNRSASVIASDISRLNALFEAGTLTAEEFALLVGKATQANNNESQSNSVQEQRLQELDKRADLAEYQRLWMSVFKNNMPLSLDENALRSRIIQLKRELQELPRDWFALTNLVGEQNNLNLLAKGQIANDISRAIKRNQPLPPLASQSISRLRSEMNALSSPLFSFAKRMGWRDMPTF
jgi:hypothetical protein